MCAAVAKRTTDERGTQYVVKGMGNKGKCRCLLNVVRDEWRERFYSLLHLSIHFKRPVSFLSSFSVYLYTNTSQLDMKGHTRMPTHRYAHASICIQRHTHSHTNTNGYLPKLNINTVLQTRLQAYTQYC